MNALPLNEKISKLKKDRDAVILAHYYTDRDVQEIADYVGDSFYLSKLATKISQATVCFAGVNFMGESAKILNPEKVVLLPELLADCPMAHMIDVDRIKLLRNTYDDLSVVCYINSTAEAKKYSDVCVTSANAVSIVKKLPNKNIYFIPDRNLGRYVAQQVPEKNIILNEGYCYVHEDITADEIISFKKNIAEDICVLVHPECSKDVLNLADYVGSTSGIIKYATESTANNFLICTECGVLHELKKINPDKKFYTLNSCTSCIDMKKITVEKIATCLENMAPEVKLSEDTMLSARRCLVRMLELAE